uniref:Immunoglobulin V-set domain-containing protein n=1 Tax=Xiphophorus couchianus TaxID=32473 RepID=A0A3B5MLM2_9TELE
MMSLRNIHIILTLYSYWYYSLINFMLSSTDVKCEQLTQPASVTVQPGQHLTISCQVSYYVSSYQTHWIRQPAGKGLEWIGYMCTGCTGARKDSLKSKFSITVEESSKTVTLNGQNLQPEDSAVFKMSTTVQSLLVLSVCKVNFL